MKDPELDQLEEKEQYDVKYISELREYWNAYMYALINEIYTGVAINLGMSPKDAYKLAKNNPNDLKKAKFFSSIFDKFKNIFNYKVPKFRYKKNIYGEGKPMSPKQWDKFNKYIDDYWKKNANVVVEDVTVKSNMLGKTTSDFRIKKKPYKNKSLYQVDFEQFDGKMPDELTEAYKKYDFSNSEKKALNKQYSSIAMYVNQQSNTIQEAIRQQVETGLENNKTPIEVASDLYWNVEKNENLVNQYTAESMRRDWNRIASTEMATVYEAGVLAPYESEAMESLKDPEKAQYFIRTGGTCEWCMSKRGTLVRLVPVDIVSDRQNESLRSMGIKDPNTDIAIWVGKNNVGLKKPDWMISAPAHPYNVATFEPIELNEQYYDKKTDSVKKAQKKDKLIPKMVDYDKRTKEERESRMPKFVGSNLVSYNNNLYEGVSHDEYNKKLAQWQKDKSKPIPVNKKSPQYRQIFDSAKENK